jgi:hypothetical protein
MLTKLCSLALAAMGLLVLAGCGTGPQSTVAPTAIAGASATPTVGPTRAPLGGTPLTVATPTPGAPAAGTPAQATPTAGAATSPAATVATSPSAAPTTGTGGPTPTSAVTPPPTGETPTAAPVSPAATPTGVSVEVIGFNVWQDFMPPLPAGGAPLYASVEFNLTNHGSAPVHAVLATRIVVRRPEGEVVLDRGLQGGPPDPVAGTDLAPGETRHYSYRSTAPDTSPVMAENEAVTGVLTLSLDSVEQTVPLPATRVLFTH